MRKVATFTLVKRLAMRPRRYVVGAGALGTMKVSVNRSQHATGVEVPITKASAQLFQRRRRCTIILEIG